MEQITAWATSLCLCAMICAVIEIMTPKGNMEKMVRFVLGLFMVCAVAVPLTDISLNFDEVFTSVEYEENSEFSQEIKNQSIRIISEKTETLVLDTVKKTGVTPEKIDVHTDIDNDNRISIVSVTIALKSVDTEKAIRVKNAVEADLGIACNTVISKNKMTGS